MKKIFLSIATIIITFGAYAQSVSESTYGTERKSDNKYYSGSENRNPPDGYMIQNGTMVMVKNGEITQVETDTILDNGTVIMSDGHYMKKDESKVMLKEGEHMDMSGKITSISRSEYTHGSDDKNYPNGYIFKNGKVMKVKNGNMTQLDVDVKLINGTAVMKNGYYMKNGEPKKKFKEGEHIDMSGQITQPNKGENTEEYNKQQNKEHPMPDSTKNSDY